MERLPVCSTEHAGCRNYYCDRCSAFTCRNCVLEDKHFDHTESIRDVKEIVLQYLNAYVRIKSDSAKALRLRLRINSLPYSQQLPALISDKVALLRSSYVSLYTTILAHKQAVVEAVRSLPFLARLRARLDRLKDCINNLQRNLVHVLDSLKEVWTGEGGALAIPLLEKCYVDRTVLEEYRRRTAALCKRIRGMGNEVKGLREMRVVTARYVNEQYLLERMCGLSYDRDFETVIYKAHYGKSRMTEYHCVSKSLTSFELEGFTMPHNFGILEIDEKLYIIGGQRKELSGINKYLNTVYLLDPAARSCVSKCGMKERRMCLSVSALMGKHIFVVGGFRNGHLLKSCERYELAEDSWVYIPPLSSAKSNCGVCTFDERLLFAFAGYVYRRDVADIEFLDLLELGGTEKWTVLAPTLRGHWEGMQNPGSLQISNADILVFGGVHRGTMLRKSFVYGVEEKSVREASDLCVDDIFLDCYSRLVYGRVHTFSCRNPSMQIYGLKSRRWKAYNEDVCW